MKQRTFVLIKPDHVNLAEKILGELDKHGCRIKTVRVEDVPRGIIESHYSPHKEKSFFKYMVDYFEGKTVVITIYKGKNVINKLVDAIGPTDPAEASQKTIRGRYGEDSIENAIAEGRPIKNVIHRSDSQEEATREIKVWEEYLS